MENPVNRLSFREIVVDILGTLVPGLIFTVTLAFVLLGPLTTFAWVITHLNGVLKHGLPVITPLPNDNSPLLNFLDKIRLLWSNSGMTMAIAFYVTVVSFVAGFLFYRQEPKQPDRESYRFLRLTGRLDSGDWVVDDGDDCEFPYAKLKRYLEARGLNHLATIIPWSDDQDEPQRYNRWRAKFKYWPGVCRYVLGFNPPKVSGKPVAESVQEDASEKIDASAKSAPVSGKTGKARRSKSFINDLKIRLEFYYPDQMGTIARNEAHVRLMSSAWYMSRSLIWWCEVAVVIAACTWYAAKSVTLPIGYTADFKRIYYFVLPLIPAAITAFSMSWLQINILKFFHYQRVREVIFVLDTAYIAFLDKPHLISDIVGKNYEEMATCRIADLRADEIAGKRVELVVQGLRFAAPEAELKL